MRRILIDGTNICRIHQAANASLDAQGAPVGILKGVLNAVIRLNRQFKPDSIVMFFDGPGGSKQRRQLYKEYKAGRKPRTLVGNAYQYLNENEAIANQDRQIEILKTLLECCAVSIIETNGYETDDGIAYAIKLNPHDEYIIVSCDKDFHQLLSNKVQIYNPIAKELCDTKWLLKKYQIHPNNWLLYRAITGDKSDNIPGVKGFGPKTVLKLFALDREEKVPLATISEGLTLMMSQEKLTSAQKTLLKRFRTLNDNLDIIKRNWTLMDLSEPMMAFAHKQQVEYRIENFKPQISQKNFYVTIKKMGGLAVSGMAPNEFVKLLRKS